MQEKLKGAGGGPPYANPQRNGNPQGFYHPSNASTMSRDNQSYISVGYSYDETQDMSQNDPNGLYQGANGRKLDRNSMVFIPNHGNNKGNIVKPGLSTFNGYANQDPSARLAPNGHDNRQKGFGNPNQNLPQNLPQGPQSHLMGRGDYWNERQPGYQQQPSPTRVAGPGQPQFAGQPGISQPRVQKYPQPHEQNPMPVHQQYQQQPPPMPQQMTPQQLQLFQQQKQEAEVAKQLMDTVRNLSKLCDDFTRTQAMHNLNKLKEKPLPIPFAKLLWESPGAVTGLLTEVISLYPLIDQKDVPQQTSERVKLALALFLPLVMFEETKKGFMAARMDQYIYPIMSLQGSAEFPTQDLQAAGFMVITGLLRKADTGLIQLIVKTTRLFETCINIMKTSVGMPLTLSSYMMNLLLAHPQVVLDVSNHPPTLQALLEGLIRVLQSILEGMIQAELSPEHKRLLGYVVVSLEKLSEQESGKSRILQMLPATAKQPASSLFKDADAQQKYTKLLNNLGLPN